ncbi:uroporphyrinogen-III synthase [Aquipuribacter sp. SD81]|uniref:uroporphyrinogen-III synthase n=1 Tax=Aquipuribacter sp. SD81 TaxID=3127703 RepID=UPI003016664A
MSADAGPATYSEPPPFGGEGSGAVRPLEGYVVGITADRRRAELATLLERKGARTMTGTAIRLVPLADDRDLLQATQALVADAPTHVVVTTGIGFRGWTEAADGWGLGDRLRETLSRARILARGPKSTGAIRANDLREEWSAVSESSGEVLERLLQEDLTRARVAVQLHGEPLPFLTQALRAAGAQVVEVPVYRWTLPEDVAGLDALVQAAAAGNVDAITFTSAPAVLATLERATALDVGDRVLARLRSRSVLACCVGPVTAGPLVDRDVPTVQPPRSRLGAMVRHLGEALPERDSHPLFVGGHRLVVLGTGVRLDGRWRDVRPTQLAVLRALCQRPGHVLSRAQLAEALPGCGDEHAVEMAVARLRGSLGDSRMVQTVVKRGYRLAYDPSASY